MANEKFPGVPLVFDGRRHLIPSLSLRQVQENYDVLTAPVEITEENLKEHFSKFVPIIGLAIRRNYPEVKDEDLLDWLDVSNFYKTLAIVKGTSGLQEIEPGE
jgi:hypothetical protein